MGLTPRARPRGMPTAGLVAALLLALGLPLRAAAEGASRPTGVPGLEPATAEAQPSPAPDGAGRRDDGRRTVRRLPENLGRGLVGVFHRDNVVPLILGSVAAGGASMLDNEVREDAANPGSDFGKAINGGAGPLVISAIELGMFTAGRFTEGSRFRAVTYDLLDASVINIGYTELLKTAIRRERPDGQDNKSFPSGHTSNAFAVASVLERHYGWKAGVPAYAAAVAVGYSRLVHDKHFLSDVVAGATLGLIVGRSVVRVNSRPLPGNGGRQATWSIAPVMARRARGLQLSLAF